MKIVLLRKEEKPLLKLNSFIIPGMDEADSKYMVPNQKGNFFFIFLDDSNYAIPISELALRAGRLKMKGSIPVSANEIHISTFNIVFRFSLDRFGTLPIRRFIDLFFNDIPVAQRPNYAWTLNPKLALNMVNKLPLGAKMVIANYFHLPQTDPRLKIFHGNFPLPSMDRDIAKYTFKPHQREAIQYMFSNPNAPAYFFQYKMGSGKTRIVAYFLCNARNNLFVLKRDLIKSLKDEIKMMGMHARFNIIEKAEDLKRPITGNTLITYSVLSRYKGWFQEPVFNYLFNFIVADEAQILQTESSSTFKNSTMISARKIALFSGTLLKNGVANSFYLAYFLRDKLALCGQDYYSKSIQVFVKGHQAYALAQSSSAQRIRQNVLNHTLIYNNKFDFDINEVNIPIKMMDHEKEAYLACLRDASDKADSGLAGGMELLKMIQKMLMLTSNYNLYFEEYQPTNRAINLSRVPSKFMVMKLIVDYHLRRGDTILIFGRSKAVIKSYRALLKFGGISSYYIDGEVKKDRIDKIVDQFRGDQRKANVLFATRAKMMYGFNFQTTRVIINIDMDWTPGDNEQANYRILRMSQIHKSVNIYNILTTGTIDEYVFNMIQLKQQGIHSFWSTDENSNYNPEAEFKANFQSLSVMIAELKTMEEDRTSRGAGGLSYNELQQISDEYQKRRKLKRKMIDQHVGQVSIKKTTIVKINIINREKKIKIPKTI